MRCLRWADNGVTIPDPGDDFSGGIDVEAIAAYEAAAVPDPANLAQGLPLPIRTVENVRVKGADGLWRSL